MRRIIRRAYPVSAHGLFLALSLAIVCISGCDSAKTDDADAEPAAKVVVDDRPTDPLAYPVPEGDAMELIQFISDIVSQEPRGATDEEKTMDVGRQMDARILAAEQLEKVAESDDQTIVAKRSKLESLRVLGMIGRESGRDDFAAYAEVLASDDADEIAKVGRLGQFQAKVDDFMTDSAGDPKTVLEALRSLFDNETADRPLLEVANETAMVFTRIGHGPEATAVFEMIGKTFANHDDEYIASSAENAFGRARMARVGVAYQKTMLGEDDTAEALMKAAKEALAVERVPGFVVMGLLNITQNLEYSGNVDTARQLYELLQDVPERVDNAQVQQQAQALVQNGLKRIQLVGQPFEVVGQTADGQEFSWADYEGKVVLVDFWATWCGPCIAEIPNVRENYDRYHDLGFEVVGVNLDDQRIQVPEFLEQNELPWVTVVSDDDQALGFDDANAKRYNVQAIPFLVLVGRDGNVDALHLRGELLNARLAELFAEDAEHLGEEADTTGAEAEAAGEVEMDVDETDTDSEPSGDLELEATETLPPAEPPDKQALLEGNPYLADEELSATELMLYLLELSDKPKSVQARAGFREAVVNAADRILAESSNEKHRQIAAQKKLDYLHRDARIGDDNLQTQLIEFVTQLEVDMPQAMADEIRFFRLEDSALEPGQSDASLIDSCCEYLETQGEALDKRHLRLASSTVEMVNALMPGDREPYFQRLAKALSASKTRDVARYGKRLAGDANKADQLIGQELDLVGVTVDGNAFDIKHYREQVVIVDFWATWCGPCRKAHPILAELAEQHDDLILVGASLDADEAALAEYLESEEVAGITIFGKEAQQAAEDLGIRGIPTFLVVNPEGKVHAVTHNPEELDEQVTALLATPLAEE